MTIDAGLASPGTRAQSEHQRPDGIRSSSHAPLIRQSETTQGQSPLLAPSRAPPNEPRSLGVAIAVKTPAIEQSTMSGHRNPTSLGRAGIAVDITRRAFVHSRIRRASIATCHQLPVMPKPRTVFRPVSASAAGAPTNGGGVGLEIGSRCATARSAASALERLTADQRPKPDFSTPCKVCSVSARVPVPTEMVMRTSASLDE